MVRGSVEVATEKKSAIGNWKSRNGDRKKIKGGVCRGSVQR